MATTNNKFSKYSDEELRLMLAIAMHDDNLKAQSSFMHFVKMVWPEFIDGYHHNILAKKFEEIASGKLKRLIVNMPPRHTKSEFASYLFPAWLMGKKPKTKIIQATHTAELSYRFGRKMRNLMDDNVFRKIYKNVSLKADSKASGRWETNHGGEYFGAGIGGAITGRGADLLIIDDPHSEQNINDTSFDNAFDWYLSGPRQRLQPGGAIVIVMTRWSERDLTGRLMKQQAEIKADQWEVIEFPAILPSGKPIWPEYWKLDELEKIKANLPVMSWEAQYQQKPTSEEGAIIKREWWKTWKREQIPDLVHVIQSYDTAFSKRDSADFSAISTWGIFKSHDGYKDNIILLDCMKDRLEFPELKKVALEQYKYWEPETVIIEAKASGMPLLQELRQVGIPVVSYTPSKGNDKLSRVNSVAPVFESGMVWAPEKQFSEEMIEECAAFPYGEHDDLVDTMTQALMRYRQGNFVSLKDDYEDKPSEPRQYVYY